MWPLLMAAVRRNIPMITVPFAAIIGMFDHRHLVDNFTFDTTIFSQDSWAII